MAYTIMVQPNQSKLDVVLMATGTLENAMDFCLATSSSITEDTDNGFVYEVDVLALAGIASDEGVLGYLRQNSIVIGTKDKPYTPPPPPPPGPDLTMAIVLKPTMYAVPNVVDTPLMLGYYSFDFKAAVGFISTYGLEAAYSYSNKMLYVTAERHLALETPEIATEDSVTAMTAREIPFKLNYVPLRGLMLAWSYQPDQVTVQPVIFRDLLGNEAYHTPVLLLDTISQNITLLLTADLLIEFVSATDTTCTIRLIRSHSPITNLTFAHREMSWVVNGLIGGGTTGGSIVGGVPDPADPTNLDKILLTLPAGNHTLGVNAVYINDFFSHDYPTSSRTMVVAIS